MKKLKLLSIFLFALFYISLLGAGCEKEDEYSDFVEGYIVGSFIGNELDANGKATENKTKRGYCILLEESKTKYFDYYTFDLPDTIFTFPDEILHPDYNGNDCGPTFFPDSLKKAYKIKFKYQTVAEPAKIQFVTGACTSLLLAFQWEDFEQVIVNEITNN